MLMAMRRFSTSKENGLFINSCFAHCQTERQDTWFADDSPVIGKKVQLTELFIFHFVLCMYYGTHKLHVCVFLVL